MQRNLKVNDERVAHEVINDEVIVIDLTTGNYFSLGGSAIEVWRLLEYHPTPAELIDALALRYPAYPDTVEESVQRFISELVSEEIVTQETDPAATSHPLPSSSPAEIPFAAPILAKYTNMSDLLLLDPIHDVDGSGWPNEKKNN